MPNAAPLSLSTTRVGNRCHDINVAADKASKRQVTLLLLQYAVTFFTSVGP